MIEINLASKKTQKKKIKIPKISAIPVKFLLIGGAVILLVAAQVVFTALITVKENKLKGLEGKWAVLEQEEKEVLAIKKEMDDLNNRLEAIEDIVTKRVLWAKKLNDLSDSMVPRVWLTSLSMDETLKKKYLSIKGGITSRKKDEAAVIGKFMKILKENKSFFKDFSDIKLGALQQKKVKEVEIMEFSITCFLKQDKQK